MLPFSKKDPYNNTYRAHQTKEKNRIASQAGSGILGWLDGRQAGKLLLAINFTFHLWSCPVLIKYLIQEMRKVWYV